MKAAFKNLEGRIWVKEISEFEHVANLLKILPAKSTEPVTWPMALGVDMNFIVRNADGSYSIMDLGGGANHPNRVLPAPAGFGPADVGFLKIVEKDGKAEVIVDWDGRDKARLAARQANRKALEAKAWNAMTPFERLSNAIRPKST